ncbi:galactose mutarotase [Alphaproteobacteria bacterium GH1-50]|uniref:Galactose mutarotase n=1 Tax=Kangsaoukella pontilimi TaxID=2691042 RepID=A0A7C9IHP3_9RHOB|nr:aldose epimerase family protein [Kangsaoukella pontilimi]MXQ09208.1 galactose mutarotase [Kangsaoukella pontilimi]
MTRDTIGEIPDGRPIERLTLSSGTLDAQVLTLGATLEQVRFPGGPGLMAEIPLPERLLPKAYVSPIVGPVANRISDATARIAGREYRFEVNEHDRTSLHSGGTGVHRALWTVTRHDAGGATLEIALPDGLGGFPGNRVMTVDYALTDAEIALTITAITDAPTLMNPAHHPYWSLGPGPGWAGHRLTVAADRVLPVDDLTLPTGEVLDVTGTPFDYRSPRVPDGTLDHNFCLGDAPAEAPRFAARIDGDGYRLNILTDAPGLQVFTGKPMGIPIEPQFWPDAPSNPHFPQIGLEPGQTFRQRSIYRFEQTGER